MDWKCSLAATETEQKPACFPYGRQTYLQTVFTQSNLLTALEIQSFLYGYSLDKPAFYNSANLINAFKKTPTNTSKDRILYN